MDDEYDFDDPDDSDIEALSDAEAEEAKFYEILNEGLEAHQMPVWKIEADLWLAQLTPNMYELTSDGSERSLAIAANFIYDLVQNPNIRSWESEALSDGRFSTTIVVIND